MRFLVGLSLRYGALALLVNVVLAEGTRAETIHVLALGDSLTAGYGLTADAAFPVRLEKALKAEGRDIAVINAGVSGDTSAGGLARIDWALAAKPALAILELGANDGLRGLEPAAMEANLDAILRRLSDRGIGVLLVGMRAPPNYGKAYQADYQAVFTRLAARHKPVFYPFFLDGVAGDPSLNQPDGLHPTAAGVDVVVARILPSVRQLLDRHHGPEAKR